MKQFKISEKKLRSMIKEGIHKALKETSYDLARNAYEKSIKTNGIGPKTNNLYNHMKDRAHQNVDMDMDVIIVGGDKEGYYKVSDLEDNFEVTGYKEPSKNPIYNDSPLIGLPRLKGLIGPMLDGDKIRYETQEAYDFFSK